MNRLSGTLLFFVGTLMSFKSSSALLPQEAANYISKSDTLAIVSILSGKQESIGGVYCGYSYKAEVREVLKGSKNEKTVLFGSANALSLGNNYLISLETDMKEFPSDTVRMFIKDEEEHYNSCFSKLPRLKENWLFTSKFTGSSWEWVIVGSNVLIPRDIEAINYQVSKVKINGIEGHPYENSNHDALPYQIKLPGLILKWSDYRSYLESIIEKN